MKSETRVYAIWSYIHRAQIQARHTSGARGQESGMMVPFVKGLVTGSAQEAGFWNIANVLLIFGSTGV
jgi:hypothetical protein